MTFSGFPRSFFAFFEELSANNEKAWFEANRVRYDDDVKAPLTEFVLAMAPRLEAISKHFIADPKKTMFRIHRDTRFSKDKSPYKTNAGLFFRHERGRDVHLPGFYVHLDSERVFYGGGIWMPEPKALGLVREAIVAKTKAWEKAKADPKVKAVYPDGLSEGDPLTRPPRGYPADHPAIEDIRKRSFFLTRESSPRAAGKAAFADEVGEGFAAAMPLVRFVAAALGETL
jgi:uncharacterized protein (TIGR02453 family)